MMRPRNARAILVAALAAGLGPAACTCGSKDGAATSEAAETMLAFEPGPEIEAKARLPDPLWALELGRLPASAQHVVLINPDALKKAIEGGALRSRLSEALSSLGGPLALSLIEGLLADVDGSRPIAVGAFALPNERELADARYGAVTDAELIPAFVHTRALVPTRDADGLLRALATAAEGLGLAPYAIDPQLSARLPPQARVYAMGKPQPGAEKPELMVLAIPDHRELRLEILWGAYTNRFHHEAQMLRVAASPREITPERSPAVDHLLVERPLLGVLERPEGAARLALTTALIEADRAVTESGSPLLAATWARGLAVALVGFEMLDPRDRVIAETSLGIDVERDLDVRSVATLTPLGSQIADEALPSGGYVYAAHPDAYAMLLQSGESMRASTKAAKTATWVRSLDDAELQARWAWGSGLATESGIRHARWPSLLTLSRVLGSQELDVAATLPDAMTLAAGHANPAPLAIALDYGPHVDVDAAKRAIESLPWPDVAPAISTHDIEGRKLLLIGIGGDPTTLIDIAQPRRPGHVERLDIARENADAPTLLPRAWSGWFEMLGPPWAGWIDTVDRARYVQAHHGSAVLGHATIALEPGQEPGEPSLRYHAESAPTPLAVVEDEQSWQCLRDIPVLAIDALDLLASHHSTPASRVAATLGFERPDWGALAGLARGEDETGRTRMARAAEALDQIWETVEPLIECGEQDPASEPTARRVRGRWLAALATWADAIPDPQRARTWAAEGCGLGDELACERNDVFHARETVAIPVRPWLSYAMLGTPSLELVLASNSMHLEGRPVSDVPDLVRSLRHRLADRPVLGHDVAVYADSAVPYVRLREVTRALLAHGLRPHIVVRDPAGRAMALGIDPAPAEDDDARTQLARLSIRRQKLERPRARVLELGDVPSAMTWGQLSERLLALGALSEEASEAEAARYRAVGSAGAVPSLVLGD